MEGDGAPVGRLRTRREVLALIALGGDPWTPALADAAAGCAGRFEIAPRID